MAERFSAHLALFNHNNEILLVKRRDVSVWVIPGGTSEAGETPVQTALREFEEETGLRLDGTDVTLAAKYLPTDSSKRAKYLFRAVSGSTGDLRTTDETAEYGFFAQARLPFPMSRYESRKITDAFSSLTGGSIERLDTVQYLAEIGVLLGHPLTLVTLLFQYLFRH